MRNAVAVGHLRDQRSGRASAQELSLMPVNRQWLPVRNGFELQEVDRLIAAGRGIIKVRRYGAAGEMPSRPL
jgi:hypothetical protein